MNAQPRQLRWYLRRSDNMKMVIKGNEATAVAAKLARPNVIPAFPITPSTLFPEKISEYVANGELDTELVLVESEHSAMSAAIGASTAGARVATATASQGLELMHEMLFIASGMRLPIVMAVGNRALSAPINIWCDHQDSISARDTGWLQFYAEKNQEALDLMLMGFRIAEDHRVLLPAMVGLDAFVLTHTMEALDVPEQEAVDEFLPPYKPLYKLDPENPMTFGSFGTPDYYPEFRYAQELAMARAEDVIDEVFAEFEKRFGRKYSKLVPHRTEDAELIFITMGSMSGTARVAVDELREKGIKAGLIKLTVFRPFPKKEILEATKHAKAVLMVDRSFSPGFGGPVYGEVAASFVNEKEKPMLLNYIVGLGGRDITRPDFFKMAELAQKALETGEYTIPEWINIRKEDVE